MFSAVGRRDYDEGSHPWQRVAAASCSTTPASRCCGATTSRVARASARGLPEEKLSDAKVPGLCDGERCLDDILLHGLDRVLADAAGNMVIVMHQLGNHGPAYFKRYPPAFRHFQPACENTDLAKCTPAEIVNAYDNALRYTDSMLAKTIAFPEDAGAAFRYRDALRFRPWRIAGARTICSCTAFRIRSRPMCRPTCRW